MEIVFPNKEYRIVFLRLKTKINDEATVESLQFILSDKEIKLIIKGISLDEERIHNLINEVGLTIKNRNIIHLDCQLENTKNENHEKNIHCVSYHPHGGINRKSHRTRTSAWRSK